MVETLQSIRDSQRFQNFIILVILAAGVVVGAQTYTGLMESHGRLLTVLDKIILWIFVVEVLIKMGAEGNRPWRYFGDWWNVFDFTIVAVCFMPFGGAYVAVLRLARILRVFRLVTSLPRLQLLVGALLRSIPSMGYVSLLLFLLFYLYAVMAVFLYGENDPVHFENLQMAMLTLFRVATLEDWTDVMYINMFGCDAYGYDTIPELCTAPSASPLGAAFFFVSFVMVGTMILMNLFIGIILNSMEETRAENELLLREDEGSDISVADEINELLTEMDGLRRKLVVLRERVDGNPAPPPSGMEAPTRARPLR